MPLVGHALSSLSSMSRPDRCIISNISESAGDSDSDDTHDVVIAGARGAADASVAVGTHEPAAVGLGVGESIPSVVTIVAVPWIAAAASKRAMVEV
jgi:hypothetical protein